jgi:ATP-dependent Zn protease
MLWVGWSLAGHAYGAAFPDPNWCLTENAPASPGLSGAIAARLAQEQALIAARLAAMEADDAGLDAALDAVARTGGDSAGAPKHAQGRMVAPRPRLAATAVK